MRGDRHVGATTKTTSLRDSKKLPGFCPGKAIFQKQDSVSRLKVGRRMD